MRSHFCGQLSESSIGQTVTLCGWADVSRNLGGVCFIDLRDHEGIVQVVAEPDNPAYAVAAEVGYEYCLKVTGTVRARHSVNSRIATGAVEVVAESIEILNTAATLPFYNHENPGEDIRLRYRYLDLRRPEMQRTMRKRTALVQALRRHLDAAGFQDIETPILTKATPEGARDYLVPSRVHPGEFFALPQSPQLFKQLLMMAGMDRYYQIARCFRDEDLRADRQPEFTQLDIEMSFVEERDVQDLAERMIRDVFRDTLEVELPDPFPRLTWRDAMERYGSDKPDLRIPMQLVSIDEHVARLEFKVFAGPAADPGSRVAALRVPGGADLSRKQIDGYADYAARYGARGLAWIKVNDAAAGLDGLQSPVAKFLDEAAWRGIAGATGAESGDILLIGAGEWLTASNFMGQLLVRIGRDRELVRDGWAPLWVNQFPMFEWDEDSSRYMAMHHPFTAPADPDPEALLADPGTALSKGYDMVLNGAEIGGGSVRIHDPRMQQAVFRLLGIGEEEAQAKFGFLLEALRYGCPPHGGIAFGLDRIAALMSGEESIRDVIAFPKTTTAQCLLTGAPSRIPDEQVAELHIRNLDGR